MQAVKQHATRDEYLRFDTNSPQKHEFYRGKIFAMSGGTFNHSGIALNIATTLRNQLRGTSCQPMNSDMRITTPSGLDTYPDISVFCNEPELSDNNCTLRNPVLLIEVLSPSTSSYDRGDKFWHYRSIPSLTDYVLVDSESVHVEHYQRQNKDEWLLHTYTQLSDTLHLKSVKTMLSLEAIYESISFSAES